MNTKALLKINEIQEKAERDLESSKKFGCNSFGCGVETGIIEACEQIRDHLII